MGTTIRREPVNFKIPKNEDFKFLNITDFRGISKSSNPLTEQYNTASDALNVYVDETNALTTRPRLEKFADLKSVTGTPSTSEFVLQSVFNLLDGFLIQYKAKASGATEYVWGLYIKRTGAGSGSVTNGNTITAKITSLFEQDNKIYFINGVNYYVIDNGSVSAVEGYIPTLKVGGTISVAGTSYESPNLLSNKYKETYFWDGSKSTESYKTNVNDTIENKYLSDITMDTVENYEILRILEDSLADINDKTLNGLKMLAVKTTGDDAKTRLYFLTIVGVEIQITPLPLVYNIPNVDYGDTYVNYGDCSSDGSVYVYYMRNGTVYIHRNDSENLQDKGWFKISRSQSLLDINEAISDHNLFPIRMSADGNTILAIEHNTPLPSTSSPTPTFMKLEWNSSNSSWTPSVWEIKASNKSVYEVSNLYGVNMSRDGSCAVFGGKLSTSFSPSPNDGPGIIYVKNFKTKWGLDLFNSSMTGYVGGLCLLLGMPNTNEIDYYTLSDENGIFIQYVEALPNDMNYKVLYMSIGTDVYTNIGFVGQQLDWLTELEENNFVISNDGKTLFIRNIEDGCLHLVNLDTLNISKTNYELPENFQQYLNYATTNTFYWINDNKIYHFSIDVTSTEPLLIVTHTIDENDEFYEEYSQNTEVRQSLLQTRFNNDNWFAKDNKTFHTMYNDPTYIPLSSYNINGDQDKITAMNVLTDSILALYKKDDLSLVNQTYDSDGNVQYYYNENNNVVGNNAFGAAITTIHSNLPIQITYDGIYTVQQQQNVAAPDRLARSISDAVGELWIAEPDVYKAEAQTLNRLYWTYILIKGKSKPSLSDPDITKVYLLDNRTLSWYYWELPLVLISSFVKDNVVYLADTEGRLSVLKSSDITKILSDRASISEYYDFDRQVIDWYWQSQILPLGTINYTKKLVNTTFIVTDTDENDGYSLQYQFNVYRRKMGATNVKNITNKLNYVQSVTKKTFISRFNFLQVKLFNMKDDLDNNKLRLVGLGLKYVLLEGML